jgi:hypothetical protein
MKIPQTVATTWIEERICMIAEALDVQKLWLDRELGVILYENHACLPARL